MRALEVVRWKNGLPAIERGSHLEPQLPRVTLVAPPRDETFGGGETLIQ